MCDLTFGIRHADVSRCQAKEIPATVKDFLEKVAKVPPTGHSVKFYCCDYAVVGNGHPDALVTSVVK